MLNKTSGMTFFIAGTTIGAGMLALPCATANLGFPMATFIMFICWAFMTACAYLLLETNLVMPKNANLISIADKTLGHGGKIITWVTYLLLLYALTAAYITGMSDWISNGLHFLFQVELSQPISASLFVVALSALILMGIRNIDYLNRVLMIGLLGSFFILIFDLVPHIQTELWTVTPNESGLSQLTLVITSFGFAIILPSLVEYSSKNPNELKTALLLGSLLPLVMYVLWDALVLGVIPMQGASSFATISAEGNTLSSLTNHLANTFNIPHLFNVIQGFSLFALSTSVLGVTLSLYDFLKDGLKKDDTFGNRILLCLITFIPPLIFAVFYPRGFVAALNFAGIFVAILLGILPTWMAYRNRKANPNLGYKVMIPNFIFPIIVLFFTGVIALELLKIAGVDI